MAKRAPLGEAPYRPLLDSEVISGALKMASPTAASVSAVVIEGAPKELRKHPEQSPSADTRTLLHIPLQSTELVEKLDNEKRMLLTRGESMALDRLVSSLAERLKTQVKASHVLRSLLTLALNAEGEIDRRAGEAGYLARPPNGDSKALQRFEKEIGKILGAAIRDAGPLR